MTKDKYNRVIPMTTVLGATTEEVAVFLKTESWSFIAVSVEYNQKMAAFYSASVCELQKMQLLIE